MPTPHSLLRSALRRGADPLLVDAGFTRRGNTYTRHLGDVRHELIVSKARMHTRGGDEWYVDATVSWRPVAHLFGETDDDHERHGAGQVNWRRLLAPDGEQTWTGPPSPDDIDRFAERFAGLVRALVLPHFAAWSAPDDILAQYQAVDVDAVPAGRLSISLAVELTAGHTPRAHALFDRATRELAPAWRARAADLWQRAPTST